jgi:hypothetical protein
MNVIGNENCKLYQELTTTPRYGLRLTCPGCSGEEFYIYRNNINTPALIDDPNGDNNNNSKLYEMVECKNSKCQIATQTFALKVKYREDKSQDFEIMGKQIVINVFECGEWGKYGEKYRELTNYAYTNYTDCDPTDLIEWQCPKHPNVKTVHIDQHIEDIPPSLKQPNVSNSKNNLG